MSIPTPEESVPSSINNLYSLHARLRGHTGIILCMSITEDGKLASGGVDGVRVWDFRNILRKHASCTDEKWSVPQLDRPSGAGDQGATTAMAWICREDEPEDGLIFGTATSLVVCWKEITRDATSYEETYCAKLSHLSEITAIAFDPSSNRLAVLNRNSVIQVFCVGPKLDLHPVFSVSIKNHIPKGMAFGITGEDKEIFTFGLYDGLIHTLSGKDGKVQHTRQMGCKIGNVAANLKRGVFCIDDPTQGVALYRSNSWDRVRTYSISVEKSMRPRPVTFLDDCKFILSGSDHGAIYMFDRRLGNMVDKLQTGVPNRIQALTATEKCETPLIFSAMSRGVDEACTIDIWRKNIDIESPFVDKGLKNDAVPLTTVWMTTTKIMMQACMLIMAVAFL